MNDHELDALLGAIGASSIRPSAPSDLRARVRMVSRETPRRRGFLPQLTGRFQSVFSATRFVVAGAIVALFGSLLLTGVLTQRPSDEPLPPAAASATSSAEADAQERPLRSDLLPGVDLLTVEVEPGVHRVLDDGAGHHLVAEPPMELLFAPDGDLVLFSRSDRAEPGVVLDGFYTVGEAGEQALDEIGAEADWFDAAFDHDGDLIVGGSGRLATFDGDSWMELTWPDGTSRVTAVEAGPDGSVWVATCEFGRSPTVARVEDGVLRVLPTPDGGTGGRYCGGTPAHLGIAPDGTTWFASDPSHDRPPVGKGLVRFDGDAWVVPTPPIEIGRRRFGPLAFGPDGTLWVYADSNRRRDGPDALLRLRDGEWSAFTEDDGLPQPGPVISWLAVDGAGTAWMAIGDVSAATEAFLPSDLSHSLISFDGSTWKQYLTGHDVHRFEVAPDGSVYATTVVRDCTDEPERCELEADGLYVITPEAIAMNG